MTNITVHPEMREGEFYLCNATLDDFDLIGWSTKRMGKVAYTYDWEVVEIYDYEDSEVYYPSYYTLYPVFVNLDELTAAGLDMNNKEDHLFAMERTWWDSATPSDNS